MTLSPTLPKTVEAGLVSVIVPTYNRADTLDRTLTSVFEQSYRPLELLVIDDGSDDNTDQVIATLQQYYSESSRVVLHYIQQERSGAQVARNRGIEQSRGEFIQFLDSDDLLTPEKIARQMLTFSQVPEAEVVYGPWRIFCESWGYQHYGALYQAVSVGSEERMLRGYLSSTWYCPPLSFLFKRKVVESVGFFDIRLLRKQDADYLTRVLINGHKFAYTEGATVYYFRSYRDHTGHPRNFSKHFPSGLKLLAKWHALLKEQGREKKYTDELLHFLVTWGNEARYMGYRSGVEDVGEMIETLFNRQRSEFGLDRTSRNWREFWKHLLVVLAKKSLGDCILDKIKRGVRLFFPTPSHSPSENQQHSG